MSIEKLLDGLDEEKVQRLLASDEQQSEEDALIGNEAGVEPAHTAMSVPHRLVPKIRDLITKRQALQAAKAANSCAEA